MKKIIILLLLFFAQTVFSQNHGQATIDSLKILVKTLKKDSTRVNILNKISQEYVNIDQKQGIQFANAAVKLSEEINHQNGLAEAYRCLGSNTDSPLALNYYNKGLLIAQTTKNKKIEGNIYRSIAVFYIYKSDYANGLAYCFKSLKISESLKDNQDIAGNLLNIGFLYNDLKETDKALYYFNKSLAKNKEFDNPMMKAVILENIGVIYNNQNKSKLAIPKLLQALSIYKKTNNLNFMATTLGTLGSCYLDLKEYNLAENHTKEALNISRNTQVNRTMSFNLGNLSTIYLAKYSDKNAEKYFKNTDILRQAILMSNEAITYDKEQSDIKALSVNYQTLTKIYEELNDVENAFLSQKKYIFYKDSIFKTETKETVKNLEDKRTIDLRDKQLRINKLSLEAKEKEKWVFILFLILVTIIGILLFYQNQNRKKTNENLQLLNVELDQANKAKTRFFSILNHDLRGPVANLIFFLQLQKESPEMLDEESTKRMQDKTMTGAENLLNSMEDILQWSKSQMENFKPQPKSVSINTLFEDTKNHFSGEENVEIRFENPDNIQINTDENYLKTIIRNLTGNAIKALNDVENPTILWKAWQFNNQLFLSITDNGKGASDEQFKALYDDKEVVGIKSGLGLHLIRDLAKVIDCEILVESKTGVGTTFKLKL